MQFTLSFELWILELNEYQIWKLYGKFLCNRNVYSFVYLCLRIINLDQFSECYYVYLVQS